MRSAYLVLTIAIAAAAPAYADSASSSLPNPFTQQQAGPGSITSADKGVGDFAAPIQSPDPQTSRQGDPGATPPAPTNAGGSSDSFYQNKKPGESDQ